MPGVQQIILPAIFVPVEDNIKIYIVRSANLALLKNQIGNNYWFFLYDKMARLHKAFRAILSVR